MGNEQYKETDNFCFKIKDGITMLIEGIPKEMKQHLSNYKFSELQNILGNKNKIHVVSDSDKKLGAVLADKEYAIIECKDNFTM